MNPITSNRPLDIEALALAGGQVGGTAPLSSLARVAQACVAGAPLGEVRWDARAQMRTGGTGEQQMWLHLEADCVVPLTCQRCLDTAQIRLRVGRWFRFVPDEASAVAQDNDCDEDLLVLDAGFALESLLEDELVLELPHIPRHDQCPAENPAPPQERRPHPFAALAGFKPGKPGT